MDLLGQKFAKLGTADAPGQEVRLRISEATLALRGDKLEGRPVDFSHGDVDAFTPIPAALDEFLAGYEAGGAQAYTEYLGSAEIRAGVAERLAAFTGGSITGDNLIISNGTQGALFLAVASTVARGTKVAIIQPDYFANRKLVEFMEGEVVPIDLAYFGNGQGAGLDLQQLEDAFKGGVQVMLFSNPNNPIGAIYSAEEVKGIAQLAGRYGVTVIADQLYSRLLYSGETYHHVSAEDIDPAQVLTVMGPSKTESLSGFRLGVAFGAPRIVERMEKLQSIVSLRAAGYNQAALRTWFAEPEGWIEERIALHEAIRDGVVQRFAAAEGVRVRRPQGGSYVFPRLPALNLSLGDFVHALRLQASVIVAPGSQFGTNSGDSIRLNFSQDRDAALAAVDRIVAMVERYRK
ncbi:pyridoxal phosphate-dependent aminotransferase [Aquabacter cavernae]|uniref:pyridoxal phosphate-dependent aminotransferase n=1 Tax=Aquabacter cavernae TaxID=2496029 RepID=UPI000F8EB33A|nr:pyridoxal phosphate-dependent aminotransferase [Aquabacter cavernae]